MFVAVILVSAVMVTYSTIRYGSGQDEPQTLSAIDETNLALKQVLGFTVGYYGSILQVTGNSSYARTLATKYLDSGLENIADIRPEWGSSFTVNNLELGTNWFTNASYSKGNIVVTYALTGLGISGVTFSASCKLDVEISMSSSSSQVCLTVLKDENVPLNDLSKQNFKFYRYRYSNLTWEMVSPSSEPTSFSNGTYQINIPPEINPYSYAIQVADTRGITVAASSFSHYTASLLFNSTFVEGDYVDNSSPNVGTQSNFTAQQYAPDSIYDSLTEGNVDTITQDYYPSNSVPLGSTTLASGSLADLQSDNGTYMRYRSYASASSSTLKTNAFVAYKTGTSSVAKERTWTGENTTWISEGSLPSSGNEVRSMRVAYSPVQQRSFEKIVITMSLDDNLDAFVWDGTAWSTTNNIGYVGPDANYYRCYDIAYEEKSGKALLVYSRGTTSDEIGYRTWTIGSGWSLESQLNLPTSGIVYWIALAAAPGTRSGTGDDNEIAMIYMDANADVYGYVWTGSSWSNMGQSSVWDTSAVTATEDCIAVAYEQQSGRAMFIWGDSISTDNYYKIWNGATLSSNTNLDIPAQGGITNWVTLKADPSSSALMYLAVDAGSDLNTAYWSGSVWTVHSEHDGSVDSNDQRCADFAWEPTGSKGLLVWGTNSGQITYRTFTGPSTWGSQQNPAMGSNTHSWVQLRTDPRTIGGDKRILGVILESADNDLGVVKWDGSSFTVIGDQTISSDTGTSTYECFDIEFMNYGPPTEFTSEVEFTGSSNTQDWNLLTWTVDSCTVAGVNVTLQLFNYQTGQYPTNEDGYLTDIVGTTDVRKEQNITVTPVDFRDAIGGWKLKFKAVKSTSSKFDVNIDLARYRTGSAVYALDLEEQWTDVNVTYMNPRPTLCIKTGAPSLDDLKVDVWHGGSWHNVLNGLAANAWNNVSVAAYLNSSTFTIRFNTSADTVQSNWQIDAVLLRPESDQDLFTSLQDPSATVAVELLQNGTMRWLGQNLQLTTDAIPLPPVPVKAFHVNQTIRVNDTFSVDEEVPFQVEDWASGYTVPLGLTDSATVFGNRQMIVFLVNTQVSKFTIWWNGSDEATQTPLAFTNTYFTGDNPDSNLLTNGQINLQLGGSFTVTSTVVGKSTSSTANFMRINLENSVYGANPAFVIHHGIVRDIVQQEAEWGTDGSGIGGADGCPNLYANIVLTLPANATYFTYQLRLMFINSAQPRAISDLCPLKLSSTSVTDIQTENGTSLNYPNVISGNGTFIDYNYPSSPSTAHHWSQFIDGAKGAGIMFTDSANQKLYAFDPYVSAAIGSLNVSISATAKTIELSPVTYPLGEVSSFPTPNTYDITWSGAVVTFDGTNPIYKEESGTKTGLWILAEIPPTITVNTDN